MSPFELTRPGAAGQRAPVLRGTNIADHSATWWATISASWVGITQSLQPIDLAAAARAFGVASFTIDDPSKCGATLDQAFATNGPMLVEAVVDPNIPPMPAKIKATQAVHMAEALARGTKGAGDIVKDIAASRIRELI